MVLGTQCVHTTKWVNSIAQRGHEVQLVTMKVIEPVHVLAHTLPLGGPFGYYLNAPFVQRLLRQFRPDIFHVHYGSGYGTLGRLANFRPCILSVWGSDVFEFPYLSACNMHIILRNLRHYDHVCATSRKMADQTLALCPELAHLSQIPFGVDSTQFYPREYAVDDLGPIVIGTVKGLENVYGIDLLLKGFATCRESLEAADPELAARLRLHIIGGGTQEAELKRLADLLGIRSVTVFEGFVPHVAIPEMLRKLDIFVAMSRAESFGVAVVEASATGLPVVATRVGGLPEVVAHGETGYLVATENIKALSEHLTTLIVDPALRRHMGAQGRTFARTHYEWEKSVDQMLEVYARVVNTRQG